ncbi:MAG: hypothetical protein ACRCYZ_06635 [Alphaproteobacteria bacterium]
MRSPRCSATHISDEWSGNKSAFDQWHREAAECLGFVPEVDKDILVNGNTLYGPSVCLPVSRELNRYMSNMSQGYMLRPDRPKPYRVRLESEGKTRSLGHFSTAEEAVSVYRKAKRKDFTERFTAELTTLFNAGLVPVAFPSADVFIEHVLDQHWPVV